VSLPDKPSLDGIEDRWSHAWAEARTYAFDATAPPRQVFSIDTPPPTVSGSLHVGHVFSYTHTDIVARYRRMRGMAVDYPMGWDDNGLPTERRVQNYYGVRCDPQLPPDPEFRPPDEPYDPPRPISRTDFIALCAELTARDEQAYESLWRRLGLSVDWSRTYTTIGYRARLVSQRMFLDNLARGEAYQAEAPTLWDVTYRTAVAQAELEDRDVAGAFHTLAFHVDGDVVLVDSTRPELLPGCVALVTHPDDDRHRSLVGRTASVPLADREVPVLAHPAADPAKGTGVAMVCTFGDLTDVTWWRDLGLPTRPVMGRDGRLLAEPYTGLTATQARARIVDDLRAAGALLGEPRPVRHAVKFYEKGDRPLEIVTSRQWYLRNGGRDEALRALLLDLGRALAWHPPWMRARYEHWVAGLTGDWLVSRQRFFGVPIPVWYRVGDDGEPRYDEVLLPAPDALPVDPATDCPPGCAPADRGRTGGFVADPDVMDTWATSSLTPYIAGGDAPRLPMDLRPQAHEIIRTWLFSTVLRAELADGVLPWRHVAISGWIVDPDRKKMSKSKGEAVTPQALLEEYGSDAARYWAARGRPGADTVFDTGQMRVGRRLATKVLNASRFVLGLGATAADASRMPDEPLDLALLDRLAAVVADATGALDDYDYARALERVEAFFWEFCDDYIELVKERAYGGRGAAPAASAKAALAIALSIQLRLLAPYLPFVTEEVWSWWQDGSVHRAAWPAGELAQPPGRTGSLLTTASVVLGAVRKAKTAAKRPMRDPVAEVVVSGDERVLDELRPAVGDLRDAGRVAALRLVTAAGDLSVGVRL